jgi:hypothetical protein
MRQGLTIPTSEQIALNALFQAELDAAGGEASRAVETVEIPLSALSARTGMSREELEQDGHHLEVRTSITSGERHEVVRLQATLVRDLTGRARSRRKRI